MTVYRYTPGEQIAVSQDTTLRFVSIADDGTISELQTAAYEILPPFAFSAQPSLLSGTTLTYGTYDLAADDVVSTADATATVTATALLREAVTALVTAGVTASSAQTLVERVLVASQVTTPVASTMQLVDALTAQIQAFPTVTDILQLAAPKPAFIFVTQPIAEGATVYYGTADTGADDVVSSADVAVSITEILTRVEQALVTVQAVPTVADMMAQIDAAASTAQAEATVTDQVIRAVAENLTSAASGLSTATDRQIMVDNVVILAESGVSLREIAAYTERVTASAGVQAMVNDNLRGSFIGSFLLRHFCSPRHFTDIASARRFNDNCSPRGRV